MATDRLDDLFGVEEIKAQQQQVIKIVDDTIKHITDASGKFRLSDLFVSDTGNITKSTEAIKKASAAMDGLIKSTQGLTDAEVKASQIRANNAQARKDETTATVALSREQERLQKLIDKEAANAVKSASAYEQLKKTYNDTAKAVLDLGIRVGVADKEFVDAAAGLKKMHDQLYEVESAIGRNQRNVGNYKSAYNGLNNAINQISRELPSFTNSIQTGLMGISNNLPILADEIARLKIKNDELVKSGQQSVPIWKSIGLSVFSWNTALSVGITLLTVFGPKLYDALFKGGEAAKAAAAANKKYAESIKSIEDNSNQAASSEISRLRVLVAVAEDEAATRIKRTHAVEELQKLYPNYLGNIDAEKIKSGEAASQIDLLTKAILQNAVAKAASDKYGAAYLRQIELYDANAKAVRNLINAEDDLDKARGRFERGGKNFEADYVTSKLAYDAAKKTREEISKQYDDAIRVSNNFQKIAEDAEKSIPDLFQKPKKDKASKEFDPTNTEISVEERINKARAERRKADIEDDALHQKIILDNEVNSLDERLKALSEYTEDKRVVNGIDEQNEIKDISDKLSRIEDIESLSVTKRTNAQKKLLLEKPALLEEELTIISKYAQKDIALTEQKEKEKQKIIAQELAKTKFTWEAYFRAVEKAYKDASDGEEAALKKQLKRQEKYAKAIAEVLGSVLNIEVDAQKNASERKGKILDDESEKIQNQRDADLKSLDFLSLSQQEKADKAAEINAKAAADEAKISAERRKQTAKDVQFEREAALAKAVLNLLLGVSKEISTKGVIGIATGAAIFGFIASITAAMTAVKVPAAYADGRIGGPSEIALVNERGPEPIGKGNSWRIANQGKPGLTQLHAGESVIPYELSPLRNKDAWMANSTSTPAYAQDTAMAQLIAGQRRLMQQSARQTSSTQVIIDRDGVRQISTQGAWSQTRILNKITK